METRAPFVIVGAFILAAIGAVFGFVYWLHNTGGLGARTSYKLQFNGPVPGLLVGASVLFNGIRVGEVVSLGLAADSPRQVDAVISVLPDTPVRADTKVGLDFQGLTGVPVVALEGGVQLVASGPVPTLVAEPGAGQSMTQAARDALKRVDAVLAENAEPLQSTIANLKIFSEGLARNTGRLDGIVAGLERMTGGGTAAAPKVVYDLDAAEDFGSNRKPIKARFVLPDPTSILMFDTQRILIMPPGGSHPEFSDFQWSDSLPKLLQAKIIQSFENYDPGHAPLRAIEGVAAEYQLLIDVRGFQIRIGSEPVAEIGFSAKILDKDGRILASRLFSEKRKLEGLTPESAVRAFSGAFGAIAKDLIIWTVTVSG
ncbi:MAG: ABC-type transport auxiliary lipoprotein family protein [Afipia sp.]|nr:ABC-type transport auxiliary lipoprotein family protein [Afipia sp.]